MLNIRNISIFLENFNLKNISIDVEKGTYFVLLGNSGAGKSLTLDSISGIRKIESGKIFLDGIDITSLDIHKRRIGYVMQDYSIFPHLSVFDNIAYSLNIKNIKKSQKISIVERWAEELNISHLLKRSSKGLSGGEKQRIALARIMVSEPNILLLDEPFSAVDIQLKEHLRSMLRKINRMGMTIFHVTHDLQEAISLADKVGVLNEGNLIFYGSINELMNNPKHPFIASFVGIKNFFKTTLFDENTNGNKFLRLPSGKEISIVTEEKSGLGYYILPSEEIILSLEKLESSASNFVSGIVVDIIPALRGIDVVVDCGDVIHVNITSSSKEKLNLKVGQSVYISWKALSGKFIPE